MRARLSSSSIDGLRAGSTGYPTSRLNWSVSRLTSSLPALTRSAVAAKNATERFPSSWRPVLIRWGSGSSRASRARAGTSRGCPSASARKLSAKGLSCSRRPSPRSAAWRSSRTRPIRPTRSRLKDVKVAARSLGVQLQLLEAGGPERVRRCLRCDGRAARGGTPRNAGPLLWFPPSTARRPRGKEPATVDVRLEGVRRRPEAS